jgi:hypothetical protein
VSAAAHKNATVTFCPRKPNKEYRTREYLVPDEVERLVKSLQGQSIAIRP